MGAPVGNKYWEFRDKHGRDFKYQPEALWDEAVKYFRWVEENPLWESVLVQKGIKETDVSGKETIVYTTIVPKMRAMTIMAFQLFADISDETWYNYKKNKDFVGITTRIEKTIYSQKFEGSSANLLNPNIIARDLGLVEKKATEHSGEVITTLTSDERDSKIKELEKRMKK